MATYRDLTEAGVTTRTAARLTGLPRTGCLRWNGWRFWRCWTPPVR